jgi:hypothetical protein
MIPYKYKKNLILIRKESPRPRSYIRYKALKKSYQSKSMVVIRKEKQPLKLHLIKDVHKLKKKI